MEPVKRTLPRSVAESGAIRGEVPIEDDRVKLLLRPLGVEVRR
jgi:hypothetical protein